jgi:hypothetical protein
LPLASPNRLTVKKGFFKFKRAAAEITMRGDWWKLSTVRNVFEEQSWHY